MLLHYDRARALMAAEGLDALVATSPENVLYASGLTSWTLDTFKDREVYAIVPYAGPLALVVSVDTADHLAERPADVDQLYTYGVYHIERNPDARLSGAEARLLQIRQTASHHASAQTALRQALTDCGVWGGRIGLDERGMPPARWQALLAFLGATTIMPAHEYFRTIRQIKTPAEVDRLRDAVRAVEAGIAAAFNIAAPGVTEAELERAFRAIVAATGATPGHFETTAGSRSAASFPASAEYRIQAGDIIRADCGGRYLGYWADTGRTKAVGTPPAELHGYYTALRAGIDALIGAIRPGVAVSALHELGVETVRAAGIPHYRRHHVGHAIGLEMYEAPLLASTASDGAGDFCVVEGMVLNIELPYYELGRGGLQLEETLVVCHDGVQLLTAASREL
jgi:Xaa-Pro dipeptidase